MSLGYAVLASLLDGEATGYELAKRMDVSVANFWHATRQQIYRELGRLEDDGLVASREVPQTGRPDKRVFTITDAGRDALRTFAAVPSRPTSIKDELLVKVQAADDADLGTVASVIDLRRREAEDRLALFERLLATYLRGRDEETFLRTASRVGPYLNLRRGRDFEAENLAWYRFAAAALRARAARPRR